jgi:hypothetical protein
MFPCPLDRDKTVSDILQYLLYASFQGVSITTAPSGNLMEDYSLKTLFKHLIYGNIPN